MGENSTIKEHVVNVVEYIESNLNNMLTWDKLSEDLYLSKYYLHRIFKSITGKGISEYVRSRKLTESLYDLVNTNILIGNIATKYGFEYESSYTRTFKSEFSVSPSEYRNNPNTVNITPKADISMVTDLENAVIIKPFHCYKPSFIIGGVNYKVGYQDNDNNFIASRAAAEFFYGKRTLISNVLNPNIYYGFTHWSQLNKDFSYYLTSVEISDISTLPEGFNYHIVPASKYTVFKFIGLFSPEKITWIQLKDIMDFVYNYFLKEKSINKNEMYQFEHVDMSICKEAYCELDLYIPVI